MRRAAMLLILLAACATASAEYRIWFTRTYYCGLTHPSLIGNPSQAITSNDSDSPPVYADNVDVYGGHYAVSAFPTYDPAQSVQRPLDFPYGEWAYVWGQFYNEPDGAVLSQCTFEIIDCRTGYLAYELMPVWYKVDDMATGRKRWDGASTEADGYAAFRQTHQDLMAVAANGLRNAAPTDPSENWNLWSGGKNDGLSGRIHLLGAICVTGFWGPWTIRIPTDQNGDPQFAINGVPTWPVVGAFSESPEPASLLLLGLAGLLIRRR